MLNARIRKRWRAGKFPIGADRREGRSDLSLRLSRRRTRDAGRACGRPAAPSPRCLKKAERPLIILGAGALARPDGAAVAALAAKAAHRARRVKDGWNGFSRAAHRGLARRRARHRLRAGRGRPQRRADGGGRRARRPLPARRRRDRHRRPAPSSSISAPTATAARIAPTSSCRAPPIRRNPASTSTPKAACRWRRAPRSRRARPARTGRSCARCPTCSGTSCPTTRSRALRAGAVQGASASAAASARSRPASAADDPASSRRSAATPDKAPFGVGDRRFLSHQSDRARVRGDGRMLGARRGRAAVTAAE